MNQLKNKPHTASRTKKPLAAQPLLENPQEISARFQSLLAAGSFRKIANQVIKNPKLLPILADQLSHGDNFARRCAFWAIEMISKKRVDISEVIPKLVPYLESEDYDIKTHTILILIWAGRNGADISATAPILARHVTDTNRELSMNAAIALSIALSKGAQVPIEDLVNSLANEFGGFWLQSMRSLVSLILDERTRDESISYVLKRLSTDGQHIIVLPTQSWQERKKTPPSTLLQALSDAVVKNWDVARSIPIPLLVDALYSDEKSCTNASRILSKAAEAGIDISPALPALTAKISEKVDTAAIRENSIAALSHAIANESSRDAALKTLNRVLTGPDIIARALAMKAMEGIVKPENAQYSIPLISHAANIGSPQLHGIAIDVLSFLVSRRIDISPSFPFLLNNAFYPLNRLDGAKSIQTLRNAYLQGDWRIRALIAKEMMDLISRPDIMAEAEKNTGTYISAMNAFAPMVADIGRLGDDPA